MEARADNPSQVRLMFGRVAWRYDLNNRLHSLGRDRMWRRAAARAAQVQPGRRVLDVACGTGEQAAELARAGGRVTALDFCEEMLQIARRKYEPLGIDWVLGDAMSMPLAPRQFAAVTIAFGLRNLPDPRAALAEFHRVLAPGGRLVVLEFTGGRPAGLWRRLLRLYTHHILPRTAGWLAHDRQGAYRYLCRSIDGYLRPEELSLLLAQSGFDNVTCRAMSLGLVSLHAARRP